jgi:hypothetical protein
MLFSRTEMNRRELQSIRTLLQLAKQLRSTLLSTFSEIRWWRLRTSTEYAEATWKKQTINNNFIRDISSETRVFFLKKETNNNK